MTDRTNRPHVQARLREIQDPNYDVRSINPSGTTVEQRMRAFQHYCNAVDKKAWDPIEQLPDGELLECFECFILDGTRYSAHTSEQNFAIMALAGEWAIDCRVEIARRMKR